MSSRTNNTKRNIIASYLVMLLQIVFSFVSKSAIVYTLGSEYLGLSSLFTSILAVLNVAELGFTVSIVYFMYKPLADENSEKVCALLNYLKKVYRIVGITILVIGFSLIPFLPKIIEGDIPAGINIHVLYVLYLINTTLSYFLSAHKTALLTAIQRLDLTKLANCIVIIVQYAFQFIALLIFKNYYLFIIAMIMGTALTNIFAAYICNRKFPEYTCKGEITVFEKKQIKSKVKGLLICNISIVTYSTLDSIVISTFVGLVSVAIYSNYMTIYKAVNQLLVIIRTAMQSSVGNSIASESVEKNLRDVYLWQFLFSMLATLCASCMICLYQPFMTLWMGTDLLLPMFNVVLIVIWFSIDIVQQAHYLYLTGAGLWNDLRYSYVFNTICNLTLNIVLGKLMGITGILMASLFTCIISGTFWQCIIIFKRYFHTSAKKYIRIQLKYFFIECIVVFISWYICNVLPFSGIMGFCIKAIISTLIPIMLILFIYRNNFYYKESKKLMHKILKR